LLRASLHWLDLNIHVYRELSRLIWFCTAVGSYDSAC
jgi:hypothetical protein